MNKPKRNRITPEQFVKTWQASKSICDAAKRMNLSVSGAQSRAFYYRKKGVKLKELPRVARRSHLLDVEALNRLCA